MWRIEQCCHLGDLRSVRIGPTREAAVFDTLTRVQGISERVHPLRRKSNRESSKRSNWIENKI